MWQVGAIGVAALVLWASAGCTMAAGPEIIAHRGASFDAPENTLAAFRLAWKQKADGIEGDFRLTVDGRIVCSHDPTTQRTGDAALEVWISAFEELRRIDVGAWKGPAWKGERMPSIEEVLGVVPAGKKIYVEIYNPRTVHVLKKAIDASGLQPEQVVVISFDRNSVRAAKKLLTGHKAYWIVSVKDDKSTGRATPSAETVLTGLKECGADGVDCCACDGIDAAYVAKIKSAGYSFHVWTVDEAGPARRLRDLGVDSITTNRPEFIREQLSAKSADKPAAPGK